MVEIVYNLVAYYPKRILTLLIVCNAFNVVCVFICFGISVWHWGFVSISMPSVKRHLPFNRKFLGVLLKKTKMNVSAINALKFIYLTLARNLISLYAISAIQIWNAWNKEIFGFETNLSQRSTTIPTQWVFACVCLCFFYNLFFSAKKNQLKTIFFQLCFSQTFT